MTRVVEESYGMNWWTVFISVLVTLFAIMDPPGTMPAGHRQTVLSVGLAP
jgi:hypothetical protein